MPSTSPSERNALVSFRRDLFGSFISWGDALFELVDALLCAQNGSVSRLATIAKTVSERIRERRPSPPVAKCSSRPSRRKYDQAAATAPKLGEPRPSISPAST